MVSQLPFQQMVILQHKFPLRSNLPVDPVHHGIGNIALPVDEVVLPLVQLGDFPLLSLIFILGKLSLELTDSISLPLNNGGLRVGCFFKLKVGVLQLFNKDCLIILLLKLIFKLLAPLALIVVLPFIVTKRAIIHLQVIKFILSKALDHLNSNLIPVSTLWTYLSFDNLRQLYTFMIVVPYSLSLSSSISLNFVHLSQFCL